jgi:hypothetical protein
MPYIGVSGLLLYNFLAPSDTSHVDPISSVLVASTPMALELNNGCYQHRTALDYD